MAKAKAGEFDAKYDISGKTKAAAKDSIGIICIKDHHSARPIYG
jgi:hypothetical protein